MGNNCAHVILTAEADKCANRRKAVAFRTMAWVGCHSSTSNDLSVHARIESTGYVRLLWETSEEDDRNTHASIFEVKLGKKVEGAITGSRERTTDTLYNDLESLANALEGAYLNTTEDNFVPPAKCIQNIKDRQLVTRSGLQRLRCRERHLDQEQAMKAPYRVRQFFRKVYQKVKLFKVSMSVQEMPVRQHTSTTNVMSTTIFTIPRLPSC